MTAQPHAQVRFHRAIERRALWLAEDAARELPNLPLEDLLQLVHLYAERGSPKYERAALRWLQRYLNESTPRLQHFAESPRTLQHLKGGGSLDALSGASLHLLRLADGADVVVSRGQTSGFTDSGLVIADGSRLRLVRFDQLPRL